VLLTTQYLDEADVLADQIVIIDRGRVIAQGSPAELKALAGRDVVEIHARDAADLPRLADALAPLGDGAPRVDAPAHRVTVPVAAGRAAIADAVRAVDVVDVEIDDIGLRRPTLDEVFLTLTGQPIDTAADGDDPHHRAANAA
jgi:ABC-2 type transport system ATP-binding protein